MLAFLHQLKEEKLISAASFYFAKFIDDQQKTAAYPIEVKNLAVFLAALITTYQQEGNTCVRLEAENLANPFQLPYEQNNELWENIAFPVETWQTTLKDHLAFTENPLSETKPLVFQFNALYFYRVWQDEYRVGQFFTQKLTQDNSSKNVEKIHQVLDSYFPSEHCQLLPNEGFPWQKIAVATALKQPFCILTGGPGTGKTTTVTRLLLALTALAEKDLTIKLVAPTGKAAARLSESMMNALKDLQRREGIEIEEETLKKLPTTAETLHRLLGLGFSDKAKYHAKNPLNLDVLVVDEASMIDLAMMSRLVLALPPQAKLILLGDQDQLSSVESGAVLAELAKFQRDEKGEILPFSEEMAVYLRQTTGENLPQQKNINLFRNALCHLVASRRFGACPLIGKLATSINRRQSQQSWQLLLDNPESREIHLISFDDYQEKNFHEQQLFCVKRVIDEAIHQYLDYFHFVHQLIEKKEPIAQHIDEIFKRFNRVRFLTAMRKGALGSEQLNEQIFQAMQQKGLLQFHQQSEHFAGRPILITQNDKHIQRYNGDIGLYLWEKDENGQVIGRYWFEDGKSVLPSRLPKHEIAFVMTVHKSQGSEFDHTILVLPLVFNPVLTKELVYTGVTRAKSRITVMTGEKIWKQAVRSATVRQSRLSEYFKNPKTN